MNKITELKVEYFEKLYRYIFFLFANLLLMFAKLFVYLVYFVFLYSDNIWKVALFERYGAIFLTLHIFLSQLCFIFFLFLLFLGITQQLMENC